MSPMQTVSRPSALPLSKAYPHHGALSSGTESSPSSPNYDRNRRAGSTPTSGIPGPIFSPRLATSTTAIPQAIFHHGSQASESKIPIQSSAAPLLRLTRRHSARGSCPISPGKVSIKTPSISYSTNPSACVKPAAKVVVETHNLINQLTRCSITRAHCKSQAQKYKDAPRPAQTSTVNNCSNKPVVRKPSTSATPVKKLLHSKSAATVNSAKLSTLAKAASNNSSSKSQTNYNQPDLVKESSTILVTHQKHQQLLKQNEQLRTRLGHNAKGFQAMAILLNHATSENGDRKIPHLEKRIQSLTSQVKEQNKILAKYELTISKLSNSEALEQELQVQFSQMQEQHRAVVEKLIQDHQTELDRLKSSQKIDILRLKEEHENTIRNLEERQSEDLKDLENHWRARLDQSSELKSNENTVLETKSQRKAEQWVEMKRGLEEKMQVLKAQIKELEDQNEARHKTGEGGQKVSQGKLSQVLAEVDSLKAVLEIKSEELRALRADKIRLEEKLIDFDIMKQSLQKATAHIEDLEAQIESKNNFERKLSSENQRLHESMEREMHEKKMLYQENEELQWKIRHSFDQSGPLSMSMIEGCASRSFTSNPMFTSMQQPLLSSMSPQSLPPFSSRPGKPSSGFRPVSAPPGKFDFGLRTLNSTPKERSQAGSPRVLEFVEKHESVSWKLQYKEDDDPSSPQVKRKLSPQSPPTSCKSRPGHPKPELMSKSMVEFTKDAKEDDGMINRPTRCSSSSNASSYVPLSSISDEDEFGDISSSSELEANEPIVEVTTPQIEEMQQSMFNFAKEEAASSPENEVTIRDELHKGWEHLMSRSMQGTSTGSGTGTASSNNNGSKKNLMSNSLPSYDLHNLFRTEVLLNSGGEALIEEDSILFFAGSPASESEQKDLTHSKASLTPMVDSLAEVSWSEDLDPLP